MDEKQKMIDKVIQSPTNSNILQLAKDGLTVADISMRLNIDERHVGTIVNKLKECKLI